MSKYHIFEYRLEEEPSGKRKITVGLSGIWIILAIAIVVMIVFGINPNDISEFARALLHH